MHRKISVKVFLLLLIISHAHFWPVSSPIHDFWFGGAERCSQSISYFNCIVPMCWLAVLCPAYLLCVSAMGSTLHRIFPFVRPALFNLLLKTLQKETLCCIWGPFSAFVACNKCCFSSMFSSVLVWASIR